MHLERMKCVLQTWCIIIQCDDVTKLNPSATPFRLFDLDG
jgi:hypothetical protein